MRAQQVAPLPRGGDAVARERDPPARGGAREGGGASGGRALPRGGDAVARERDPPHAVATSCAPPARGRCGPRERDRNVCGASGGRALPCV